MPVYAGKRKRAGGYRRGGRRGAVPAYNAERRQFPASRFMRQYHARTADSRAAYGVSAARATPEQLALRRAHNVFGRGRYSVGRNWRKFAQGVGLAGAGRRLVGSAAGLAAGMIGGMGEYTTNSLFAEGSIADEVPQVDGDGMASSGDETGAVTVTRREFITDIVPTAGLAFELQQYRVNPGLETTFPWLSQIAANYEEYEMKQLVFFYRSTTTDVGTTTTGQCGTVVMATQYNPNQAMFVDKPSMQAYEGAMSCKSTESMAHGVECDIHKRAGVDSHYVRVGPVSDRDDIKDYDFAAFNLAMANMPAAFAGQSIGELWVTYTVELRKPKIGSARGNLIQSDLYMGPTFISPSTMIGSSTTLTSGAGNNIGTVLSVITNGVTIQFPPSYVGTVEIRLVLESATIAAGVSVGLTATGNVNAVNDLLGASNDGIDFPGYFLQTAAGITAGTYVYIAHVRVGPVIGTVPATPNTVTLQFSGGAPTAWTQSVLSISEYATPMSSRSLNQGQAALQTDQPILLTRTGQVYSY